MRMKSTGKRLIEISVHDVCGKNEIYLYFRHTIVTYNHYARRINHPSIY